MGSSHPNTNKRHHNENTCAGETTFNRHSQLDGGELERANRDILTDIKFYRRTGEEVQYSDFVGILQHECTCDTKAKIH